VTTDFSINVTDTTGDSVTDNTTSVIAANPQLLFTANQIEAEYFAIIRSELPPDQATTIANEINSGTLTQAQFISNLLAQVTDTTIPAVAVGASMYNSVESSAKIDYLSTGYLPVQEAHALQYGFNALVYGCEVLGFAFSFDNGESGTALATTFATNFGPSNATYPATIAGDAAFAAAASSTIFGSAATPHTIAAIEGWVANWKAFFAANGVIGHTPTADNIDLAARGAAWGDAVGVALANNLGPLPGQVANFLEDAAQGSAIYSAPLSSQPIHAPFQGASMASTASAASPVELTGLAAPLDHLIM
jgi:hypothetical protein